MTAPLAIQRCYSQAAAKAGLHPYVFGGGHNAQFAPSGAARVEPLLGHPGYDCSGWVSAILFAGGLTAVPLDTHGLASWGLPGEGEHMTVWVINNSMIEHAVIHFRHLPHSWSVAAKTGTICGWVPNFNPSGYTTRRRKP